MTARKLPSVRLAAAAALLLTACAPAAAGNWFAPAAAVVDGVKVPQVEVSRQLARVVSDPQFAEQFRGPQATQIRQQAEREILLRLLRARVVAREAPEIGVSVEPEEVAAQLESVRGQFPSEGAFRDELRRQRVTVPEVETLIRDQILLERVVREVTKGVAVSEEQLARHYEQNREQFASQIRAAHILVCANFNAATRTCATTPEDEATAGQVAARARAGEDFARLAGQFSADAGTKARGGDLGWFAKGQLAPEFDQAAQAMEPGQISDPVRTRFGFHVIKLIGKGKPLAEAREEIEEALVQEPRQQAFEEWLRKAFSGSRIRVHPRFGRFDATTLSIVPRTQEAARPSPARRGSPAPTPSPAR